MLQSHHKQTFRLSSLFRTFTAIVSLFNHKYDSSNLTAGKGTHVCLCFMLPPPPEMAGTKAKLVAASPIGSNQIQSEWDMASRNHCLAYMSPLEVWCIHQLQHSHGNSILPLKVSLICSFSLLRGSSLEA